MNVRTIVMVVAMLGSSSAYADLSKEECVDAHARGQDARDQNKLTLARKLFLTCAQAGCPTLVQNDCSRFFDDLTRAQPTVSLAARDASGADLPDTAVYIDGVLVATRLDDGKPYDADPGPHTIKFIHNDQTRSSTIVLNSGEKGRTIVVTFGTAPTATPERGDARPPPAREPAVRHPLGSKILIGAGVAAILGGAAFGIYSFTTVPDDCSVFDHTCQGTPGNATYDDASSAVRNANLGFAISGAGAAMLIGGIVWYIKGKTTESSESMAAIPWLTPDGGGLAVTGRL